MLELDARKKRNQAYTIDGSLRPPIMPIMASPSADFGEVEPEVLAAPEEVLLEAADPVKRKRKP